ncbi:hypothetical protein [Actinomadura rudentiformis]|uniref:Uncharacterized protein n=1 Tax=Actinomadura rudentiformis TaxID=359158 RepID=A0A6H9YQE1_9ACTN|nr:hypothetical protein [Actinomadura rudentiformis]KAB2341496.1 hypothetical protein F8566_40805 [Actinomadura rudentiformis]
MNVAKSAYDDQFQAAVSDVRRYMNLHAQKTGSSVGPSDAAWIKAKFDEFALDLLSGKGSRCPHIGPFPMVAHTATWATHQLVCPACIDPIKPSEEEDRRCDRCGATTATLHAGQRSRPGTTGVTPRTPTVVLRA